MTRMAATFTFTFTGRKARGCLAVRLGSDVTIGRLRGSVRGLVAEAQETLLIWLSRAKITIIWHLMSILQLEKKLSAENRDRQKPLILPAFFTEPNIPLSSVYKCPWSLLPTKPN